MFEVNAIDDVAVLHLDGELSHGEMMALEKTLGQLVRFQKIKIILDFKNVEHVNYKTLQTLLQRAEKLRQLDGDLKCAALNHYTQNIFRFTGADRIVESYASVDDAVLSFHGEAQPQRTQH